MNKDRGRRNELQDDVGDADADMKAARDRLLDAVEAAANDASSADATSEDVEWIRRVAHSGVLRSAPMSRAALDIVAELMPLASVTSELRGRLQEQRSARREALRLGNKLEAECRSASPGELFHDLRVRAGVSPEQAASFFGLSSREWLLIEAKKSPWYDIPTEGLSVFANAVSESADRLVDLIAVAARRHLFLGIAVRAGHALGRFDTPQRAGDARRDTLRAAFAAVETENRNAAAFLARARLALGPTGCEGGAGRPNQRSSR